MIFFLLLCHAKQACPKQDYMTWQFIRGDVQSVRFSMKTVWTLGLRISVISGCLREWVCVAALSLGFSTGLFVRWPMTFSSDMFATAVGTYLCGCSDACKAIVIVNHFPLLLILYYCINCFIVLPLESCSLLKKCCPFFFLYRPFSLKTIKTLFLVKCHKLCHLYGTSVACFFLFYFFIRQ